MNLQTSAGSLNLSNLLDATRVNLAEFSGFPGMLEPTFDYCAPFAANLFSDPAIANRRRRFEILLPLQFNNGKRVPLELLDKARSEIVDEFDAVSCETAQIEGYWRSQNCIVRDNLIRLWVDVADIEANRLWMKQFKERWKRRLDQDDLWLIDYEIELN